MTVTGKPKQLPTMSNVRIQDTKCLKDLYEDNPKLQVFNQDSQYDGSESLNSKVHVHLADVTDVLVDAIVCSTQTNLLLEPYGLCKTVWSRGGQELVKHCRHISFCQEGDAFITQGYDLPVKYIIHTAGPPPDTSLSYEERKQCLRQSYLSCLQIVGGKDDIKTVAIPCLGSGGAAIQLSHAVHIGVTALREWLDIGDNKTKLDNILLCMYDEEQWEEYYPQLIRTFPYGKDCAGYDLESLPKVTANSVHIAPEGLHQSNISSIYCFKYNSDQKQRLTFHFHSLVDSCLMRLGRSADPNNSVIRYNSCARFELHLRNHHCIIYHTKFSTYTAIEIQVISMDRMSQSLNNDVCRQVIDEVAGYLDSFLENVATPVTSIRCRNSGWGEEDGLWEMEVLKRTIQFACIHQRFEDTHQVKSYDLLVNWNVSLENSENYNQSLASGRREPVEHGEREQGASAGGNGRQGQENSWSFPSQQSETTSQGTEVKRADANSPRPSSSAMPDSSSEQVGRLSGLRGFFNKITGKDSKKHSTAAVAASSVPGERTVEKVKSSIDGHDGSGGPDHNQPPPGNDLSLKYHRSQSDRGPQSERKHYQYLTVSKDTRSCPGAEGGKGLSNLSDKVLMAEDARSCRVRDLVDLSDKVLMTAARLIGNKQLELGIHLDLGDAEVQRIRGEHPGNLNSQGFYILKSWKLQQNRAGKQPSLRDLLEEMDTCRIDTESIRNEHNIPWD